MCGGPGSGLFSELPAAPLTVGETQTGQFWFLISAFQFSRQTRAEHQNSTRYQCDRDCVLMRQCGSHK